MNQPISSEGRAPLFARYQPRAESGFRTHPPYEIRAAQPDDVSAVARIVAEREGGSFEYHRSLVEGWLERSASGPPVLIAASGGGAVAAYARTSFFEPADDAPSNIAPRGWYLAGLVVAPEQRRRGIGLALTRARLEWIAQRSNEAHYFCNAQNLASIALHASCGFIELTRDFTFPGAQFEGGVGVLYGARLR